MRRNHCVQCTRPLSACYCPLIKQCVNDWPVVILQHIGESRHALGTARIAALSLKNCSLTTVSESTQTSTQLLDQALPHASVLIYPGAAAAPVSELLNRSACPLIFIDATWRKSRRMLHEMPQLANLPRYGLHDLPASRYRIRKTNQSGAVSTLEAIIHTLELLEAAPGKYTSLLSAMDWMLAQQISHIGASRLQSNYE